MQPTLIPTQMAVPQPTIAMVPTMAVQHPVNIFDVLSQNLYMKILMFRQHRKIRN